MKHLLSACVLAAGATSAVQAQLQTQSHVTGLDRPVFITHANDGSGRLFIIEQEGAIRVVDSDGNLLATPFLDIDAIVTGGTSGGNEQGMLGLAFHPDYATEGADGEGKFYVNYIGAGSDTYVVEYEVLAADPNLANPGTARLVMKVDQPFSNHNGGWLGFGPDDGFLYIALGDGGSGNDPGNRAANLGNYLGKMHRIDIDSADDFPADADHNYAIPADNPFIADSGAIDSIWHYGLRNPWRSSFDSENGDLWMADVGQSAREEVNHDIGNMGGNNYGWRCREGNISTGLSCGSSGFVDPVHDYTRAGGNCSVTGGYVYRGCELGEEYQGLYFFGDYCGGNVWTLDPDNGYSRVTEFNFGFGLSSFGQDEAGELYIADLFGGEVFRIVNPDAADKNEDGIVDACESACLPDINGDGELDFFDISGFLTAYSAEEMIADFNGDGEYDFFDISAFLTAYSAGCP
ncbi:MAG: PQQ-dependent sugar dehydrogenase [Phycisphaerales bacterium]